LEQESKNRHRPNTFSSAWEREAGGKIVTKFVVGYEIVTMDDGTLALLLKVADGKSHLAQINDGSAKPTNVQLSIQSPFARELAVGLAESARESMEAAGRKDS
jgi:hypothetical protein